MFVLWKRCWRVRLTEELSIRYVLEGSVQKSGDKLRISGRRQPSCDGMSRMMREYHVRICEGLGVKFPGPTRHEQTLWGHAPNVRLTPDSGHSTPTSAFAPITSALPPATDILG